MLLNILFVALGGALGSTARFSLSLVIDNFKLPIATFLVNFVGSLLLGLAIGVLSKSHPLYFMGVIGFCGGFTTFSTFSYEVVRFIRSGELLHALLYVIASVLVCVIATYIGLKITNNTI